MRVPGFAEAFVAAALLSVPASAGVPDGNVAVLENSAAFITLNTQVPPLDGRLITLRLDVRSADENDVSCDSGEVAINGQLLSTPFHTRGEGDVPLDDGSVLSAQWAFTCYPVDGLHVPPRLVLDFTLTGHDDERLSRPSSFSTQFRRTTPVEFISFSSPDVDMAVEVFTTEYGGPSSAVEKLEITTVEVSEEHPPVYLVQNKPSAELEEAVEDCDSLGCFVDSVADDLIETADHLYDDVMAKESQWQDHPEKTGAAVYADNDQPSKDTLVEPSDHPSHEDSPQAEQQSSDHDEDGNWDVVVNPTMNSQMKPMTSTDDSTSSIPVVPSPTPTARFMPSIPPPDQDLVMTLTIAIAAFSLFSIVGIIAGTRRLAPHIQRRPRHRETREERLARVAERRRAVRNFLSGLLCGIFGYEEKVDEQGPQGRDLRGYRTGGTQQQDSADTTMEQELAGLRNAADMVSNLIAAEEGRNNQMLQQRMQQQQEQQEQREQREQEEQRQAPPQVPNPMRAAYPGFLPGGALPPSYENDTVDASMVSDGFRHVPGGTDYSPSSPTDSGAQTNSNSDRLGYGNKD